MMPDAAARPISVRGCLWHASMSWTLPTLMPLFAGAVAVWPLAAVVRRPTSSLRLLAEAFGTTPAVIGLV